MQEKEHKHNLKKVPKKTSKNKIHASKDSPNMRKQQFLVRYSHKENTKENKKQQTKRNDEKVVTKKKREVRKMFDKEKVKLGIAPIAWTNDDMPDLGSENTFEQCVSEMALAGFTGSEVGNKYPKDTKVLKQALALRGVEICNQWFSAFLITKPFEEVEKEFRAQLAYLKEMGAKVIGASEQSYSVQGMLDTPIFGHKYVMNDEEWKTFCEGIGPSKSIVQ